MALMLFPFVMKTGGRGGRTADESSGFHSPILEENLQGRGRAWVRVGAPCLLFLGHLQPMSAPLPHISQQPCGFISYLTSCLMSSAEG